MSYRIITYFPNEKTCYYVPHESSTFQSLDELLEYTDGWSSTDEPVQKTFVINPIFYQLKEKFRNAPFGNPVKTTTSSQNSDINEENIKVPSYPAMIMSTSFATDKENRKSIIDIVNEILRERGDTVSFHFVPSESTWLCTHITCRNHCRFDVHIYRFSESEKERRGTEYAVELHKIEGDGWIFRSIYEDHRAKLDPEYDPPIPYADDDELIDPLEKASADLLPDLPPDLLPDLPPDFPSALPPGPERGESMMSCGMVSSEYDVDSDLQPPSDEDFKKRVIETLQCGNSHHLVEVIQDIATMYGSRHIGMPTTLDETIVRELVKNVCTSVTCVDLPAQHAMFAIMYLSKNSDYHIIIDESQSEDNCGEDIYARLFRLTTMEATYRSEITQFNSSIALANFIVSNCVKVLDRIGGNDIQRNITAIFVRVSLDRKLLLSTKLGMRWAESTELMDLKKTMFELLDACIESHGGKVDIHND